MFIWGLRKKKRVKTDRKWAECTECTAQGQPRRPGHEPPARPAPACRAPSALPPACACAQLPRTPKRPLRSSAAAACLRLPARPRTPACSPRPAPTHACRACLRAPSAPAQRAPYACPAPSLLLKWAVAHFRFCTQKKFSFFIINDFFFHLFPKIGKISKITKIIFFLDTQINL